jgi:hypothetical protein
MLRICIKYRFIAVGFLTFLMSFNSYADSPLTSIQFWSLSNENLVIRTGEKQGKKKLNQKRIKFLFDSKQSTFDKIALVNALGWEHESEIKNATTFMEALENAYSDQLKRNLKSDKREGDYDKETYGSEKDFYEFQKESFLKRTDREKIENAFFELDWSGSLANEMYLIYQYLKAMDNINEAPFSDFEIDWLEPQDYECYLFIRGLFRAQELFINSELCDFLNTFQSSFSRENNCSFENEQIKEAVRLGNNYMYQNLAGNCEKISFEVGNSCTPAEIIAKPSQLLWVQNYPAFVYGNLVVYDSNYSVVDEQKIDGDDYVELKLTNYSPGTYCIRLEDENKNKYELKLKIAL